MTDSQSRLRNLHFLLKHALGNIPLERRIGATGIANPADYMNFGKEE